MAVLQAQIAVDLAARDKPSPRCEVLLVPNLGVGADVGLTAVEGYAEHLLRTCLDQYTFYALLAGGFLREWVLISDDNDAEAWCFGDEVKQIGDCLPVSGIGQFGRLELPVYRVALNLTPEGGQVVPFDEDRRNLVVAGKPMGRPGISESLIAECLT